MNYSRLAFAGAAVLALSFSSCGSVTKTVQKVTKPPADGKLFAVTADSVAFFRHGPQQGREPDQKLSKNTLVKLIRPSFGYSKVQLVASGEQGYVASDEITPASSMLVASTTTTVRTESSHSTPPSPAAEQFNLNSDDPRLVPPPEDLPDPDLPAPPPGQ